MNRIVRAALLFAAVSVQGAAADPEYVEFDVPGASNTWVYGLNSKGDTVGDYLAGGGGSFIRTKKGVFTVITPSGAHPHLVNRKRQTSGVFSDSNGAYGFIGAADGTWTSFEAPGAQGFHPYTAPTAITDTGAIAGYFGNNGGLAAQGFIRRPLGKFVTFAVDELHNFGTFATAMTEDGLVYGYYLDADSVLHGFSRDLQGAISPIDLREAGRGQLQGTKIAAANASQTIAGTYVDAHGQQHAFLRRSGGKTITIGLPTGSMDITVTGLNGTNAVVGFYQDAQTNAHSFLRTPDGQLLSVDEPHGTHWGTFPYGINDKGVIAGSYLDGSMNSHGFIRKP